MIQYPIEFKSTVSAGAGTKSAWETQAEDRTTLCAVPPEFGGGGGGMSPEDLYLQALTNCFTATLKVYCEASKIEFEKLEVDSRLVVDKNDKGQPWMKEAHFRVRLQGASRADRLQSLAERAIKNGFILNSVKTQLSWEVEIDGSPALSLPLS